MEILIYKILKRKISLLMVPIARLACLAPPPHNPSSNHRFLTYSTKEKLGELKLSEYNYFLTKT